jgi:hypothetical protein
MCSLPTPDRSVVELDRAGQCEQRESGCELGALL